MDIIAYIIFKDKRSGHYIFVDNKVTLAPPSDQWSKDSVLYELELLLSILL